MVKAAAPARVWERYPGAPLRRDARRRSTSTLVVPDRRRERRSTGPYVHAWSDLDDNDDAGRRRGDRRTGGSFAFTFTPRTTGTGCNARFPCSWDSTVANSWATNRDQNGVQAFYLANRFRDHLAAAPINFTGLRGRRHGSRLHTDDGASTGPDNDHLNNANMLTLPEGTSPVMQMYLWGRTTAAATRFRDVNSGDDAVDPVPRVHARALEPARDRRGRLGA